MQIDDHVLKNLEKLSCLHIDKDKRDTVKEQLSNILAYIESLNELQTDTIDTHFSTLEGGTPLRVDQPEKKMDISKQILAHAPEAKDDFFIVPAIIE